MIQAVIHRLELYLFHNKKKLLVKLCLILFSFIFFSLKMNSKKELNLLVLFFINFFFCNKPKQHINLHESYSQYSENKIKKLIFVLICKNIICPCRAQEFLLQFYL